MLECFLLPLDLSQLPISPALLQQYQAWANQPSRKSFITMADLQILSHLKKGKQWVKARVSCYWAPDCFPIEQWEPVLALGLLWGILTFTPDCQPSLRAAQITRGTGLAVASGLLLVSHCSDSLTAPVKPTFSHIKTRKFAHVSLWISFSQQR